MKKAKKYNRPKVKLDPDYNFKEEKQVTVICWLNNNIKARILPTTYLICNQTGKRSKLLYTENIAIYPDWHRLKSGERFMMVFEPLNNDCLTFDLFEEAQELVVEWWEEIPELFEFHSKHIVRNQMDCYKVRMKCMSDQPGILISTLAKLKRLKKWILNKIGFESDN
jgi:hypothetical protein